jgi:hypothetical protein
MREKTRKGGVDRGGRDNVGGTKRGMESLRWRDGEEEGEKGRDGEEEREQGRDGEAE